MLYKVQLQVLLNKLIGIPVVASPLIMTCKYFGCYGPTHAL